MWSTIILIFFIPYSLQIFVENGSSDPQKNMMEAKADQTKVLNVPEPKDIKNYTEIKKHKPKADGNVIESGAFVRGIWLFVGFSLLFFMYLAFQNYRKRSNRNIMVNKYGVRTRRNDLEMEPLPLSEDEEDETVFDLKNVNQR